MKAPNILPQLPNMSDMSKYHKQDRQAAQYIYTLISFHISKTPLWCYFSTIRSSVANVGINMK